MLRDAEGEDVMRGEREEEGDMEDEGERVINADEVLEIRGERETLEDAVLERVMRGLDEGDTEPVPVRVPTGEFEGEGVILLLREMLVEPLVLDVEELLGLMVTNALGVFDCSVEREFEDEVLGERLGRELVDGEVDVDVELEGRGDEDSEFETEALREALP